MKNAPSLLLLPLVLAALGAVHCDGGGGGGTNVPLIPDGGGADVEAQVDAGEEEPDKPLVPATKVDLLFVVDNSASMGDKQALFATSVNRILRRLIEPTSGHAPIRDVHVGVISTSLGTMGGDVCDPSNGRTNDQAHLLNAKKGGGVVEGAEAGFLAFGGDGIKDVATLEKAAADIILGVDQTGCGLEAQLESMYRFLAQPDPPLTITLDANNKAQYVGTDYDLLAQRKAFLRPDSAVAVVMITDEDDSAVDPRAIKGQGWAFSAKNFPGSQVFRGTAAQGTTAARGTSACASAPASPQCVSCAIGCGDDPLCGDATQDANCKTSGQSGQSGPGFDGFYAGEDDSLNVRFHRMKHRFGVDPQFPIERYVRALTNRRVPDRTTEHDADGKYVHAPTCTNPLFAGSLPVKGDGLCALPEGDRSRELVFFGLIGGVPNQLLGGGAPDWTKILGQSPDTYDEAGIDPHMIQSVTPRPGLQGADLPRGNNGTDPVNGREWNTNRGDLQYACTFNLAVPRTCNANDPGCECSPDSTTNPPLCGQNNEQVRAKAYPTPRELRVAKGLGARAAVASICAPALDGGYGPLLDGLATKMEASLAK